MKDHFLSAYDAPVDLGRRVVSAKILIDLDARQNETCGNLTRAGKKLNRESHALLLVPKMIRLCGAHAQLSLCIFFFDGFVFQASKDSLKSFKHA